MLALVVDRCIASSSSSTVTSRPSRAHLTMRTNYKPQAIRQRFPRGQRCRPFLGEKIHRSLVSIFSTKKFTLRVTEVLISIFLNFSFRQPCASRWLNSVPTDGGWICQFMLQRIDSRWPSVMIQWRHRCHFVHVVIEGQKRGRTLPPTAGLIYTFAVITTGSDCSPPVVDIDWHSLY